MVRVTPIPVNPLYPLFIGAGAPAMYVVRNGVAYPISDIPKPQGAAGVKKEVFEFAQKHFMDSKSHRKMKKRRVARSKGTTPVEKPKITTIDIVFVNLTENKKAPAKMQPGRTP